METEIIKGNLLIAEFMGFTINEDLNLCMDKIPLFKPTDLKYHSKWDSLMRVVEKIAKNYDVRITWMPTGVDVTYIDRPDVDNGEITSMGGLTAIENTWTAVIKFIDWYNIKSANRKTPTTP